MGTHTTVTLLKQVSSRLQFGQAYTTLQSCIGPKGDSIASAYSECFVFDAARHASQITSVGLWWWKYGEAAKCLVGRYQPVRLHAGGA